MINVSELINDPDFACRLRIIHAPAEWVNGRYERGEETSKTYTGIAQPATPTELLSLPEADRKQGVMSFWFKRSVEISLSDDEKYSDRVLWEGERYRVMKIESYKIHGYIRAFGILERTATDGSD